MIYIKRNTTNFSGMEEVLKTAKRNDTIKTSVAGILLGGLLGSGAGYLFADKKNKLKNSLKGALIGGLVGTGISMKGALNPSYGNYIYEARINDIYNEKQREKLSNLGFFDKLTGVDDKIQEKINTYDSLVKEAKDIVDNTPFYKLNF